MKGATNSLVLQYKQEICALALLFTLSLSGYLYILSLQGGTFDYMKEHLQEIGSYLFISVFTYIIGLNFILFLPIFSRIHRSILTAIWLLFILLIYLIDHDDVMERHGYFNFVAYCMIIGFVQSCVVSCYLATRSIVYMHRIVRRVVLTVLIVLLLVTCVKLNAWHVVRQDKFRSGLFGQKMAPAGNLTSICHLDDTPIAWMDIVPPYVQSFWAGRWWCPSVSYAPEVSFNNNQMHIYCTHSRDVFVEIIPSSIGWTGEMKENLQKYMMERKVNKLLRISKNRPAIVDLDAPDVSPHEAFRITCSSKFVEKHSRIVVRPRRNQRVVERVQNILKDQNSSDRQKPLNVVILFLDAVSRKHFQRKFPKTIQVMEKLRAHYNRNANDKKATGIFQFFRYHSVDFSTDDNTRALYLGKIRFGTPFRLLPDIMDATKSAPIWSNYMNNGYVSARIDNFCEDWPQKYNQFVADPDHEFITPFCLPQYLKDTNNIIDGPYGILHRCLSGRHVHTYNFEYLDLFWETYKDTPKFITSAFIEGHEVTGDIIEDVDGDMAKFITQMKQSGKLDDTILLLMSDHGLHCGIPPLFTASGTIEHFNPFMFWFIPNEILTKYNLKDNLETNSQRLVTAFDIHETLKHILSLGQEVKPTAERQFGESLFTNRISADRTCAHVRIRDKWCRCSPVPTTTTTR